MKARVSVLAISICLQPGPEAKPKASKKGKEQKREEGAKDKREKRRIRKKREEKNRKEKKTEKRRVSKKREEKDRKEKGCGPDEDKGTEAVGTAAGGGRNGDKRKCGVRCGL